MLLDTPLKTKILSFLASAEWYDFGSDTLTFFPKTFGSLCRMAKSLGVSPMKIQPFKAVHAFLFYNKTIGDRNYTAHH